MEHNNQVIPVDLVAAAAVQNQDKLQEVQELELETLAEVLIVFLLQMDGEMMEEAELQVQDFLVVAVVVLQLMAQPQEILEQLVVLEVMD
jgi:hypothetical protein